MSGTDQPKSPVILREGMAWGGSDPEQREEKASRRPSRLLLSRDMLHWGGTEPKTTNQ